MNEIVYPITLDYVKHWKDPWPIIREIVTNSLDADPGFRMGLNEDSTFWVEDRGDGLAIRHLLLGVSEKDPGARGQFGEGLKLALLALTRENLTAHIYSGDRHLWNEPAEMEGEQVFKICWENGMSYEGTRIEVKDWPWHTFEERFLRPGDPRIAYTDPFGRSILEQEVPDLFVKGVWVQRAKSYGKGYAFGYDLVDVQMNRDRGVVNAWDANHEIGKLWASVADEELLTQFWQAVKDSMGEKDCRLHGVPIGDKRSMKRAFQSVYGKDAVLSTSPEMEREAAYRGASPVSRLEVGGSGIAEVVEDMVGTDAAYVAELEGASKVVLPDKKLDEKPLKTLKMLRRLARRIGFDGKILAYILPGDVEGEAQRGDIRVSINTLSDDKDAIAVMLHEMAHIQYQTADTTAQHATAIAAVAAELITSYARR